MTEVEASNESQQEEKTEESFEEFAPSEQLAFEVGGEPLLAIQRELRAAHALPINQEQEQEIKEFLYAVHSKKADGKLDDEDADESTSSSTSSDGSSGDDVVDAAQAVPPPPAVPKAAAKAKVKGKAVTRGRPKVKAVDKQLVDDEDSEDVEFVKLHFKKSADAFFHAMKPRIVFEFEEEPVKRNEWSIVLHVKWSGYCMTLAARESATKKQGKVLCIDAFHKIMGFLVLPKGRSFLDFGEDLSYYVFSRQPDVMDLYASHYPPASQLCEEE